MKKETSVVFAAVLVAAGVFGVTELQQAQLESDMEQAAVDAPGLAPLVKRVCPDCEVEINCYKIGEDKRDDGTLVPLFCRNGLVYGLGVGGVTSDGRPAACVPDPAIDQPWPCTGDQADWPEKVEKLLRQDDAAVLEALSIEMEKREAAK